MKKQWVIFVMLIFALNICYAQMLPPEFGPVRKKPVYKPRPIPAGPNADCLEKYKKAYIAWRVPKYVNAYKKHGSTNPKWDDKAIDSIKSFLHLRWEYTPETKEKHIGLWRLSLRLRSHQRRKSFTKKMTVCK